MTSKKHRKNKELTRKLLNSFLAFSLLLGGTLPVAYPTAALAAGGVSDAKVIEAEISEDETDGDSEDQELSPRLIEETPTTDTSAATGNSEGRDLSVEEIQIQGNRLVPTEAITQVLKTKPGDRFDRSQVLDDLQAINDMGYFDDKSLQVVPERTTSGVLLKIRVVENAPVTQFSFQGNNVIDSKEISKIFADQLGKPQNLTQLSHSIEKLEELYHEKGFLLARVTDVKDFPDGSVSLTVNEGQVDKIEITGNRKTKDFIIKNAIGLKEGAVYNEQQLTQDLRKLYGNGYFQDIRRSLQPSPDDPNKFILKVEVDEKRTGSIGLGGGVDSMAGPFGSLSFSDNNFKGRGQQLSFNSQLGSGMLSNLNNSINNGGNSFLPTGRTYQVEASWTEPHLRGTDTSLSVNGFGRNYASLLIDQAQQRSLGASVTLSKPLKRNFHLNLGLMGENTSLKDLGNYLSTGSAVESMAQRALSMGKATDLASANALAGSVRSDQLQGGTFFSLNPSLVYDTRDAYIDPTRGTHAKISVGPSIGLSGASFAKAGASFSKFKPLGKSTTLAFNIQGGSAVGGMPQFAQYRLGGWNGIRGYRQFSDLGTGTSMLMATAEVRTRVPLPKSSKVGQMIDKHVKLAAFADVGGVSGNGLSNGLFGRSNMGASVGLGLRVKLPMLGLVRIDYGLPLLNAALGGWTPRLTVGFGEKF